MVNAAVPPAGLRLKERVIGLAPAALGLLLLYLSLVDLVPALRAAASRAPLIAFYPNDARTIVGAIACFAFASLFLFAPNVPPIERRGRLEANPRTLRWTGFWLVASVALTLLALFAAPIAEVAADSWLGNRGYRLCPAAKTWEHHPPLRWVRNPADCP